jgi:uncharacterized protein (TIGR03437 family)
VDTTGIVYIADTDNNAIRAVDLTGNISVVVNMNGTPDVFGDKGPALNAALDGPRAVAVAADGTYFIADTNNLRIRVVSKGSIDTLAGGGPFKAPIDGVPATLAYLSNPTGITLAQRADPRLFFDDTNAFRVRGISNAGIISTFAGDGINGFNERSGPAFPAATEPVGAPQGVLDTPYGVFLTETNAPAIFLTALDGTRYIIAGNGQAGYAGDGLGPLCGDSPLGVQFNHPTGLAMDANSNLYIADTGNNRVRVIQNLLGACPNISTFAGTGGTGLSSDNVAATSAALNAPTGLAIDWQGNLLISESGNNRIRLVTPDGLIHTVAGTGTAGFGGDGGSAPQAQLNNPVGVFGDGVGNLLIADQGNNRIRYVTTDGIMHTLAGTGAAGFSGDGGDPSVAQLNSPSGVIVGNQGEVYLTDSGNDRIRVVVLNSTGLPSAKAVTLTFPAAGSRIIAGGPVSPQQFVPVSAQPSADNLLDAIGAPFTVSVDPGSSWLKISPASGTLPVQVGVAIDPSQLPAGDQTGVFHINSPLSGFTVNVTVRVHVDSQPPLLKVDSRALQYTFTQGGPSASKPITIANTGGGTLSVTCSVQTNSGGAWLSLDVCGQTPTTISAGASLTVTATATPPAQAGAYTAAVVVSAPGQTPQNIPVTMTVNPKAASLALTQRSLAFIALSGSDPRSVPFQSFGVVNLGRGSMGWTATAKVSSGEVPWLSASVAGGTSIAGSQDNPGIDVQVDASQLKPGTYTGQIRIDAPAAANSPQFVTVTVQARSPSASVPVRVAPLLLVFTAPSALSPPGSQSVVLSNFGTSAQSYRAVPNPDAAAWLVVAPAAGTVAPGSIVNLVVQPKVGGLAAQVYSSGFSLQFQDGSVASVAVHLVVGGAPLVGFRTSRRVRATETAPAGCTATGLLPGFFSLGPGAGDTFITSRSVQVWVVDTCAEDFTDGTVAVSFGNATQIQLLHFREGEWQGTWDADPGLQSVVVGIQAADSTGALTGNAQQTFSLGYPASGMSIQTNGVVSRVNPSSVLPLAPGSLITIQGQNFVGNEVDDPGWQPSLGGVTLQTGASTVRVHQVAPGQILGVLPYDLGTNTTQQLVITSASDSAQTLIPIADAVPFIPTDQSGTPTASIVRAADGSTQQYTANSTLHPGDVLNLTCYGLGAVQDPVNAESGTPGAGTVVNAVTVLLGGSSYPADQAQLIAGTPGTYQVLFTIPASAGSGSMSFGLSESAIQSNSITVTIGN